MKKASLTSHQSNALPKTRKSPRKLTKFCHLDALPLELLILVSSTCFRPSSSDLDLDRRVDRSGRLCFPGDSQEIWKNARKREKLPDLQSWELSSPLEEVRLANLIWGRNCRNCSKRNVRSVDFFLRARLCKDCEKAALIYESPDEPDPKFAKFFPGTKRFTPRHRTGKKWKSLRTFFLRSSVEATSDFLTELYKRYISDTRLFDEPEYEDLLLHPPAEIQLALDQRQKRVNQIRQDAQLLHGWYESVKKRERVLYRNDKKAQQK